MLTSTHSLIAATWLALLTAACGTDSPPPLAPGSVTPRPETSPSRAAQHFQTRGNQAFADFFSVDPAGCIETYVFVLGTEEGFHQHLGAPFATGPSAYVLVDQFDSCNDFQVSRIIGSPGIDGGALFTTNRRLTGAQLQATIPAFDLVSNAWVSVTVNVDWTGTGELVSTSDMFRRQSPGGIIIIRSSGSSRGATASGTVSLDAVNLIPNPSSSAVIGRFRVSDLHVQHSVP